MWDGVGVGVGVGVGWDSVSSLQSFIETEDGSVYKFTSKLPLHSVATQDKINPHKKPSLVPFPPSSLCHIFYIVIVYNSMVNTYYQSPKPELVLLPSPSSLPSVTFFTLLL